MYALFQMVHANTQASTLPKVSSVDYAIHDIISNDVIIAINSTLYEGVIGLTTMAIIFLIIVLILLCIRFIFLNYTKSGRRYKHNTVIQAIEKLKQNYSKMFDENIAPIRANIQNNIARKSFSDNIILADKTSLTSTQSSFLKLNNILRRNNSDKVIEVEKLPFICKFKSDLSFELVYANDQFYTLLNLKNMSNAKAHYYKQHVINNGIYDSLLPSSTCEIISSIKSTKKNDPSNDYKITIHDIFNLPQTQFINIIDAINKDNSLSEDFTSNGIMLLKNTNDGSNVSIKYQIYIDNDKTYGKVIVIQFHIHSITAKINPISNYTILSNQLHKEVLRNLLIDIPMPIFIVDMAGIKFVNKTTCDWFNIDYDVMEKLCKESSQMNISAITNKIDKNLTTFIDEILDGSTDIKPFYREYIIDQQTKDIQNELHINMLPRNVIVHMQPFIDDNNNRQIFIIVNEASSVHQYIIDSPNYTFTKDGYNTFKTMLCDTSCEEIKKSLKNEVNISPVTSVIKNEEEIISLIDLYKDKWKMFKGFFSATRMISFGRIDLKTKEIIGCNDSFEELLRFDNHKNCYINIIDHIIDGANANKNKLNNIYIYDIHFKNREMRLIYSYCYNYNVVDIIFVERANRGYLSNNSFDMLSKLYETSDIPIITVNKIGQIITYNSSFKEIFLNNHNITEDNSDKPLSLIDLIPQSEKHKVKRAISDSIKFNSNSYYDTITMVNSKGFSENYVFKCIKSYGMIGDEKYITITILSTDDSKKKGAQ